LAAPGLAINNRTAAILSDDGFDATRAARAGLAEGEELEVLTSAGSVGKLLVMVGKGGAKKIAETVCPGPRGILSVVFLISVGKPVWELMMSLPF
jgi:hypothetical protein